MTPAEAPQWSCFSCPWTGTLPDDASQCPQCGDVVGVAVMQMDDPPVDTRPELGLSAEQQRRGFPREFWVDWTERAARGELWIDPQVFGRGVAPHLRAPAPLAPPEPPTSSRGRPRENPDYPATPQTRARIVTALAELMYLRRAHSQSAVMAHLGWYGDVGQIQRVVKALGRRDGLTTWNGLKVEAHVKAEDWRRGDVNP
jgi:hypothetical protein